MKKLLALMLFLCLLASLLFVFTSCDMFGGKNNRNTDKDEEEEEEATAFTNIPTTSKGTTITQAEWRGMLNAINYCCSVDAGNALLSKTYWASNGSYGNSTLGSSFPTEYYTVIDGTPYRVTSGPNGTVAFETEAVSPTIGQLIFNGIFSESDYQSLKYNSNTQQYELTRGSGMASVVCYFSFVDGVIKSATLDNNTYTFSGYGTTTLSIPNTQQ